MPDQRLRYLFHRWFDKTASDEERAELMALLRDQGNDDEVRTLLEAAWQRLEEGEAVFDKARSEDMLRRVLGTAPVEEAVPAREAEPIRVKRRPVITMRRAAAAAVRPAHRRCGTTRRSRTRRRRARSRGRRRGTDGHPSRPRRRRRPVRVRARAERRCHRGPPTRASRFGTCRWRAPRRRRPRPVPRARGRRPRSACRGQHGGERRAQGESTRALAV